MIIIDGSQGEGSGQILRTSLALSLVTGQSFRRERIRAKRQQPGVLKQHLTAVEAAKAWLEAGVPVEEHLADQFRMPMVLAGGGSFRTTQPSRHTATKAEVIRALFLQLSTFSRKANRRGA